MKFLAKLLITAVALVAGICWGVAALGYPTEAIILGWIGALVIFYGACELFFS